MINLVDTLVECIGSVLYNALHRVIISSGEQKQHNRRSLVYLVRYEDAGSIKRLKGSRIPLLEEGESN